ncbi:NACHT domain-containing protein [Stigmatella hybrida]|uniref:NACHT domain-containing protein n=1 Tax=Stigmatella hybrida TaxID=394097 RepID=UPI001CDACF46|nr:HEAT repeat domain-containing protein [Stigmatella hybrida]
MTSERWKILIAHAEDEEDRAEQLAEPLRAAGYEVAHRGTVLVGDSILAAASSVLSLGGPVVVCATVAAVGTGWANELTQAARKNGAKIFVVRMQPKVYTDLLAADEVVAEYWKDPDTATRALIKALQKHYPLSEDHAIALRAGNRRQRALDRYRSLALDSCDIVDLANLPDGDRHLATRTLELRRLFVSVHVCVEVETGRREDIIPHEAELTRIEERRANFRLHAAGRRSKDSYTSDRSDKSLRIVTLGERLREVRRLVVLGDPGAGKTTLLRWLATAYLLRLKHDPAFKDLPDVETLPEEDWLPVLIRCRDLDQNCIQGSLETILQHVLRKTGMAEDETTALLEMLREKLDAGDALLLIDGLDEIADPRARANFCQQLEQLRVTFSKAPIVVTSRIVGYREMGYRIGRSFDHVSVADLGRAEKDDFARRWCALTEPTERRDRSTADLIKAIHSSERIEQLTGNAMLLTTTALVKRQVGQLPSRRAELYYEAVKVLLRWRSEQDAPLDPEEALPQLEYLAYSMCDRGVQRLREGEILDLLVQMRQEFPQQRRAANHSPEEFLRLLERRTGLVVETGREVYEGIEVPVFEFRHLTFQEYMAGRALAYGRFANPTNAPRDEVVSRLAGQTAPVNLQEDLLDQLEQPEIAVTENWREALRLCVGCRRDSADIDTTLLAILNARDHEDETVTARPRAILAMECLADEPSVREETALSVLHQVVTYFQSGDIYGHGARDTLFYRAALELANSEWSHQFEKELVTEFMTSSWDRRSDLGGLVAEVRHLRHKKDPLQTLLVDQLAALQSGDVHRAIASALHLMQLAFQKSLPYADNPQFQHVTEACNALLSMLESSVPVRHAATWALGWMSEHGFWKPNHANQRRLLEFIADESADHEVVYWSLFALKPTCITDDAILERLSDPSLRIKSKAVEFIGTNHDRRGIELLLRMLKHPDDAEPYAIISALGNIPDPRAVQALWERITSRNIRLQASTALVKNPDPSATEFVGKGLKHADPAIRRGIAKALLRNRGDARTSMLLTMHNDPDQTIRRAATEAFAITCSDHLDRELLSWTGDAKSLWIDPRLPVDDSRVRTLADKLALTPEIIRARYENIAIHFPLCLTWLSKKA